jgi:DNA-binding MarR family transcriptional regulator
VLSKFLVALHQFWHKDIHLVAAPALACIELNPGPDHPSREDQRKEIVILHEKAGCGSHRIAKELKIDRRTVQRVLKKFKVKKTCRRALVRAESVRFQVIF